MKTSTLLIPLVLLIFSDSNAQTNYNLINHHEKFFQNTSQPLPSHIEANWYNEAEKNIEESQYFFQYLEKQNSYSPANTKNAMRFDVKGDE